jgi:hypothetical protein
LYFAKTSRKNRADIAPSFSFTKTTRRNCAGIARCLN